MIPLLQLARTTLERHEWDIAKAKDNLIRQIRSRPDYISESISMAAQQLLQNVGSAQRTALETAAIVVAQRHTGTHGASAYARGGDNALRKIAETPFLATWLVRGKPLGECTADDLRESISNRKATAAKHSARAVFETAILRALGADPGKKTVGNILHEDDVKRIARKHAMTAADSE